MVEDNQTTKAIRFGCGGLLGLVVGGVIWVRVAVSFESQLGWLVIPVLFVVFGVLSLVKGDRFWHGLRDWLGWW